MRELAEHLNDVTRGAKKCQRDAAMLYLSLYFAREPQEALAVLKEVRDDALLVVLPRFGLDA